MLREFFLFRLRSGMMRHHFEADTDVHPGRPVTQPYSRCWHIAGRAHCGFGEVYPRGPAGVCQGHNATLDVKEQNPGNPGAELLMQRAAELLYRVMPDLKA